MKVIQPQRTKLKAVGNWNSAMRNLLQITIVTVFFVIARNAAQLITRMICRHNPEINWDQEVTWHQWQNVIVGDKEFITDEARKFLFKTNDDWQSYKNILQKMKRTLIQVSCLCLFSK